VCRFTGMILSGRSTLQRERCRALLHDHKPGLPDVQQGALKPEAVTGIVGSTNNRFGVLTVLRRI
jgi:hypothetical protein